jgi:methylphosphotriester-DNA--protein-cysteine methyltransferase
MIRHTELGESKFARSRKLKELINDGKIRFGGNRKLKIYGMLDCPSGTRMNPGNRVFFESEGEAKENGYRPCGHCMRMAYLQWRKHVCL